MNQIRITLPDPPTGARAVELDGVDIAHAVQSLTIEARGGQPDRITLDLTPGVATIAAYGDIVIRDDVARLLAMLGWTPPADETGDPT
jgi:hypothetical protein